MKKSKLAPVRTQKAVPELLRIDIGSGKNPKEGFIGIDAIDFGQEYQADLRYAPWALCGEKRAGWIDYLQRTGMAHIPQGVARKTGKWMLPDNAVDEVHSSHFVEHLTGAERIGFFNELYRVMKPGAVATIVTPNWSHARAYGDPTHQWPPMSSWYPLYLNKEWRSTQAPHVPFTCDFNHSIAGAWDGRLNGRTPEYTQTAMNNETNAWADLIVTLTKR